MNDKGKFGPLRGGGGGELGELKGVRGVRLDIEENKEKVQW